jgi:phage gpG-like protein
MIQFDVNDTALQEWFHDYGERDIGPALEEIGAMLVDSVKETIDSEGHGDWEPAAYDYGHPLLKDTNSLYNSIRYQISGDEITVSHGVDYGDYQNEGTSRIPARPFLVMQQQDLAMAEEIIANLFS